MREVERLLTAASVTVRSIDPAHPDARAGIRAYVAELERRFPEGFDPGAGVTAEPAGSTAQRRVPRGLSSP